MFAPPDGVSVSLLTLLTTGVGVMPTSVSGVVCRELFFGKVTRPRAVAAPNALGVCASFPNRFRASDIGSGDGGGGAGEWISPRCKFCNFSTS